MDKYEAELIEANDLLRSALSIANRNGISTNWEAFARRVGDALDRQLPMINELKSRMKPNFAACCSATDISVCDCVNKKHVYMAYNKHEAPIATP